MSDDQPEPRPRDPFLLNYKPSELRIASEFLSTWAPFLSKDLCQHCTQTLSDRIRSLDLGNSLFNFDSIFFYFCFPNFFFFFFGLLFLCYRFCFVVFVGLVGFRLGFLLSFTVCCKKYIYIIFFLLVSEFV